jgi:hypothetical protein
VESFRIVWGDLWHFPFWAEVWGTVAAWFAAFGTVLSIGTAAFYYVKNLRREAKAQARHVTFVHDHWTNTEYVTQIHNFSDKAIFDVTPMRGRKLFRELLGDEYRTKGRPPTSDEIEELRGRWESTSGGTMYVQSLESGHMKPGEAKKVVFEGTRNPAERYWIQFRDAMARTWTLELDRREPQRIHDAPDEECEWWHIFIHPRCFLQQRKERRKLNGWIDDTLGN